MPAKPAASVKGQSSLFSFFKKPNQPSPAPAPKAAFSVTPTTNEFSSKAPSVSPQNDSSTSQHTKLNEVLGNVSQESSPKRKNDSPVVLNKSSKKAKPSVPKRSIADDEDEWDEDAALKDTSESEGAGSDEDSEFALSGDSEASGSASDEESLVDSESEDDSDYGGRGSGKRQKLRRGAAKTGLASKLPPSGRKGATAPTSAHKVSQSSNSSTFSATPQHQSHDRYNNCNNNTVTPATGSSRGSGVFCGSSPAAGINRLVTPDSAASLASRGSPQGYSPPMASNTSRCASGSGSGGATVADKALLALPEGVLGQGSHEHNSLPFLQPDRRRDHQGRPAGHPDYNPRTLQVPESFMRDQTPAMHQWWLFKSMNMDTVLFFKVGKFYELFHMDADVGFTELDLVYMKGAKGHSGFPEIAYGKFSSALVGKGYRVARIEQTETPDMLKARNDKSRGKKDKVVAREVCAVMSKGTRTYCHLDDLSLLDDPVSAFEKARSVTASIKELRVLRSAPAAAAAGGALSANEVGEDAEDMASRVAAEYGICLVDTVIGTVTLAQFADDEQRTRLRTMLVRYAPSEVLLERPNADGSSNCSPETMGVIQLVCPRAVVDWLHPADEMLSPSATLEKLQNGLYFEAVADTIGTEGVEAGLPPILQAVVDGAVDGSSALALSAFGGALWQLQRSFIDYDVLSLRKVFAYVPSDNEYLMQQQPRDSSEGATGGATADSRALSQVLAPLVASGEDSLEMSAATSQESQLTEDGSLLVSPQESSTTGTSTGSPVEEPRSMVLDEVALSNLEILVNNHDGSEKGSLWSFVNKCQTDFGRRLLRTWLCNPLYRVRDIQRRSAAVQELLCDFPEECDRVRTTLHNLPDLERLLARVHVNGLRRRGAQEHPDSRAILYEMDAYNKRKIKDFADVLNGFERVLAIGKTFQKCEVRSPLLALCVKPAAADGEPPSVGRFPTAKMESLLAFFRKIFDERQAKADGCIKPRPGVHPAYDAARSDVLRLEQEFEQYLREMKRETGISDMKYFGTNKDRYQLEVAMGASSKVPRDWTTKSQKKTHRRYWTAAIEQRLELLVDAEARAAAAQLDTLRSVFERFDGSAQVWGEALTCVSMLDALQSLAQVSSLPGYVQPTIVYPAATHGPVLDIVAGRHPMLELTLSRRGGGDYIPNDVRLGSKGSNGGDGASSASSCPAPAAARTMLLSGPNMGGKSTLLRQTCLIAVLAQMGCRVPAEACTLSPVDRIFTRVGASDRILAGQSTFFIELAETAMILKCATENSLCILDELGRGTATFDGTAIAHAVVEHIVSRCGARCLFATHYHTLIDDWEIDPRVQLAHMDAVVASAAGEVGGIGGDEGVQDDAQDSAEANSRDVMFLYKLVAGSSPRSYGINVARLAGLPPAVIALATQQSALFEERVKAASVSALGGAMAGTATAVAAVLNRNRISSVIERLVSIARSWEVVAQSQSPSQSHCRGGISVDELAEVAKEVWRRCATYVAEL